MHRDYSRREDAIQKFEALTVLIPRSRCLSDVYVNGIKKAAHHQTHVTQLGSIHSKPSVLAMLSRLPCRFGHACG